MQNTISARIQSIIECDVVDISDHMGETILTVGYQVRLPRGFDGNYAEDAMRERLNRVGTNEAEEVKLKLADVERKLEQLQELQKYKDFYDLYKGLK